MDKEPLTPSNIVLYQTENGNDYRHLLYLKTETFWLTQKGMAELFDVNVPAISKHLQNIYEEGELVREATVSKKEMVQEEGKRDVRRIIDFYNLDAIIAVGYRVNSKQATAFRKWATQTLKEYIIKGFVLNDDMLKNGRPFGKDYLESFLNASVLFVQANGVSGSRSPIFLQSAALIMIKIRP